MLSALPRALEPWSAALSLFPRELAVGLGSLVQRLSVAIGPLRRRDQRGAGEPDGFDGLSRRGSYERLLASEWLLADELPDEFLRRAAVGEHAFFRLAHRVPEGTRRSIVLFDAGPSQLGSPRLVHLAALVVLARRAEAAGAQFAWGIAQRPSGALVEELSAASVLGLISGRAGSEVGDEDLRRWTERLGEPERDDDVWLVGDARLAALRTPRTSHLSVRDVLEPGARAVAVSIQRASSVALSPEVTLELPEREACVRLLRDPFAARATRTSAPTSAGFVLKGRPISNLVFSADGRRLYVRVEGGKVAILRVPDSPRAQIGKPRYLEAGVGHWLVAAGAYAKSHVLVSLNATERNAQVELVGHRGGHGSVTDLYPAGLDQQRVDPPLYSLPGLGVCLDREKVTGWTNRFVCRDPLGRLFHLTPAPYPIVGPRATALARVQGDLVWVTNGESWAEGAHKPRTIEVWSKGSPQVVKQLDGDGDLAAFFGYGGYITHPVVGLLALRQHGDRWRIYFQHGYRPAGSWEYTDEPAPPEGTVVGVASQAYRDVGPALAYRPGLVVLDHDRRTLRWVSGNERAAFVPSDSPIAQVACATGSSLIAWTTENGELFVAELEGGAVRMRLTSTPATGAKR